MGKVFKLKTYPEKTMVFSDMDRADYFDSYMTISQTSDTVGEITKKLLESPPWVNVLMRLRDFIVRPFGLKTEDTDASPGFDLAPVLFSDENEIIMGMNDKHLYFRLSVLKMNETNASKIYLSTVVRFNNVGGKIYFAVIWPFHRLIVPTMLRKL